MHSGDKRMTDRNSPETHKFQRVTPELLLDSQQPAIPPFPSLVPEPQQVPGTASSVGGVVAQPYPPFDMSTLSKLLEQQVASLMQLQEFVQRLAIAHSTSQTTVAQVLPTPAAPAKKELRFAVSPSLSSKMISEGVKFRKELHRLSAATFL